MGFGLHAESATINKAIQIIFMLRIKKILERNKFTVLKSNFENNKPK